jgi:Ala-tRNA(Pro) deacylase
METGDEEIKLGVVETASPKDVLRRLEDLDIATVTYDHPPLFTVEDSKALRGPLPGGHCKNLFLKGKKNKMWLLVCREDQSVNLKALGAKLEGERLSFGSPERLMTYLGVIPGAVSPFALINDLQTDINVILDKDMLLLSPLNFHPITNEKTIAIQPDDLLKYIRSCGHQPKILDLN